MTHRCLCPTRAPHTYACIVLQLAAAEQQRDALAAAIEGILSRNLGQDRYLEFLRREMNGGSPLIWSAMPCAPLPSRFGMSIPSL